jgi:hypothetical protein
MASTQDYYAEARCVMAATKPKTDGDRLVLALANIEEAEESLRAARKLIRELFAGTPGGWRLALGAVADDEPEAA